MVCYKCDPKAPIGFVVQDVVADAMTVKAVPTHDDNEQLISNDEIKSMHTTMQTLGRFAIISGSMLVALINVVIFVGLTPLMRNSVLSSMRKCVFMR